MSLIDEIKKQPPEYQLELIKHYQRSHYKSSLYLTVKGLLNYKDVNTRTHKDTIEALEAISAIDAEDKRALIVLPRGTFKSTIGTIGFPIWLLLNDPNERILIDSELYTNSKNYLREIKAKLQEEEIEYLFGDFKGITWGESEIIIKQRTIPAKEASVTAAGIGTEKTGQHYTTIICDDLNSPNNSGTQEGIEKVINHFRYNMSILEPSGKLIVIATRYAERDIPGFVLHEIIGGD